MNELATINPKDEVGRMKEKKASFYLAMYLLLTVAAISWVDLFGFFDTETEDLRQQHRSRMGGT